MGIITQPAILNESHYVENFDCGNETLTHWLKQRALRNQNSGSSRTFVITKNDHVIGYYALATGSAERLIIPKSIARNMLDPIPCIILARLAIDIQYQGQRLGDALLKDVMLRTLIVSKEVGIRALLVHAISEDAKKFYLNYGFCESPMDPMTLFLSIKHIKAHLCGRRQSTTGLPVGE